MKTLLLLWLTISTTSFAQSLREVSAENINVKIQPRKVLFGKINDGSYIDVYDGQQLLFKTFTSDSVPEAKREVEAFINRQKLLAQSFKKKLYIDVKSAHKSYGALDEVKALFSFHEDDDFESKHYKDCIQELQSNIDNVDGLNQKLVQSLIQKEVLYVNGKDLAVKYVQAKTLGFNDGVIAEIYVKNKLVRAVEVELTSMEDVQKEFKPLIDRAHASKKPVILQFGKSQQKGNLKSRVDEFRDIFSQN